MEALFRNSYHASISRVREVVRYGMFPFRNKKLRGIETKALLKTLKDTLTIPSEDSDDPDIEVSIPHRDLLQQRKTGTANYLHKVNAAKETLPIFTALFEIIDISDYPMIGLNLVLRPDIMHDYHKLRVAYDRTYQCTQTSHSAFALLESNRPFRLIFMRGIPAHGLRILPIDRKCSHFLNLPRDTLRKIIRIATVSESSDTWRSQLFSYGMVCKSWAENLDLFYSLYTNGDKQVTASAVAGSLRHHPKRARLIERFSPDDYRDETLDTLPEAPDQYLRRCEVFLEILRLATSITEIEITAIPESLIEGFSQALYALRGIERCKIESSHNGFVPHPSSSKQSISMADIQMFTAHWSRLSNLEISNFDADRPRR
jgi:hypothetical protein